MYYQILPKAMRGLSRDALEYLSAHSGEAYFRTQDGELEVAQLEKLRANADRARYEPERRDRLRAATLTTLVPAAVGGGAGAIAAWWLTSL